jgi:N-acetylneuraminic acid mutarotase
MQGRERKIFLAIAAAFSAAFVVFLLAAVGPLDLPGSWRTTLGLEDEYPPCAPGLYHKSPASPPRPTGHWRFEPESPRAEVENSAVAIGPIVYSTNGQTGNFRRVLAYDTRRRRWSEPTRSPIGLNHSQAAAYRGDIYLASGYLEGEEATDSFLRYEPKEDRWTELPPLQQARGAAAAAVVGDRLYVVGGSPQIFGKSLTGEPYDSLEIYDFRAKEWSSGADIPEPRHHAVGVGLGGKLYVAGGRVGLFEENNSLPPTDAFDRYDPLTDEWESLPPIPLITSFEGITTAAGKVVVVGGENQTHWEEGGGWVTSTAWAFDPKTERWQRLPDMSFDRRGFGLATAGGRIYALMGSYCPGLTEKGPEATRTVESLPVSALKGGEAPPRRG